MILPRWHYLHIHNVIPALKRKGVTKEHLKEMLAENPRMNDRGGLLTPALCPFDESKWCARLAG